MGTEGEKDASQEQGEKANEGEDKESVKPSHRREAVTGLCGVAMLLPSALERERVAVLCCYTLVCQSRS